MLGFLGSIFSGGVTGLFGVGIQRLFDFLHAKELAKAKIADYTHQENMKRIDGELMAQEWAARAKVADIEAAGREAVADANAFAESFKMEPKRYSDAKKIGPIANGFLVVLDFIRGIVRPGLTIYLCVITTMIYLEARAIVAGIDYAINAMSMLDIYQQIISTVLYLTTTVVLWWFGTRNKAKQPGAE